MTATKLRNAGVGLIYLVVIAGLIALSIAIYNKAFSSFVTVTVHTDNVGNSLQTGSDVKVRGVLVGSVKRISTNGTGATITLDLNPDKAKTLPTNVTAQLLPKTLFGERYVNLELPATPSGTTLASGDSIAQDTSQPSIELENFFTDLLPVLRATEPQKLQSALTELATGFNEQGNSLRVTALQLGQVLHQLAPNVPKLAVDLRRLNRVAGVYTTAAPEIIDALKSAATVNQTIVAQRKEVESLFTSVTSMSNAITDVVGTNSNAIIGLSANSVATLKLLDQYGTEFPCVTRALVSDIPTINKALGVGTSTPGAHVIVHVIHRVGPYRPGADQPHVGTTAGPSCPYVPTTKSLSGTALSSVPGLAGTTPVSAGHAPSPDLGLVNSPAENSYIDELMAPSVGLEPSSYPDWASLLLGPALRGATVTLK